MTIRVAKVACMFCFCVALLGNEHGRAHAEGDQASRFRHFAPRRDACERCLVDQESTEACSTCYGSSPACPGKRCPVVLSAVAPPTPDGGSCGTCAPARVPMTICTACSFDRQTRRFEGSFDGVTLLYVDRMALLRSGPDGSIASHVWSADDAADDESRAAPQQLSLVLPENDGYSDDISVLYRVRLDHKSTWITQDVYRGSGIAGAACDSEGQCNGGLVCEDHLCAVPTGPDTTSPICMLDTDCAEGLACIDFTCTSQP